MQKRDSKKCSKINVKTGTSRMEEVKSAQFPLLEA